MKKGQGIYQTIDKEGVVKRCLSYTHFSQGFIEGMDGNERYDDERVYHTIMR